tara:strand:+ start:2224 stop:2889 length:666 start_codon:yes stop_codon:yes gene_type:complete
MGFKMKHLGGGNPPIQMHGEPHAIDPVKAKAEAEAKANTPKAPKVYGKPTTTVENVTTPGGNVRGTRTTVTKPYTQSGTGSFTKNKTYNQLAAEGGDVKAAKAFNAANSTSGKDVTSTFKPNKLTSTPLKPMGITPISPKISSTIPTITPRAAINTTGTTPKKKKKKTNRRQSYILQDTGRAIENVGEAIGKGVGNVVSNVGYAFTSRGIIGSLFGCKTCR